MKKTALIFSLNLLLLTALAQPHWETRKSGGYTYRQVSQDPMAARFYTLKNGLTVILSVNHAEPRIAARIAVRTGSNNDPRDHTGLAHYLEHLLFKGTSQYGSLNWAAEKIYLDSIENLYEVYQATTDPDRRKAIYRHIDQTSVAASRYAIANEYDKLMAGIGSQGTNAHTWVEETVYEEDIPSNAVDKFLTVQSERFKDPVFRLFHTELEAVYEEKNRGLDNDGNKLGEAMNRYLFPTNNYGQQTTIGTIEHLKNPSIKAIKEYYNKYYVPNNMAIILSGDLNPDETIAKIDGAFAYMKSKPVTPYDPAPEKPLEKKMTDSIYGPSAESVHVGFRTPAAGSRDALVLDLISSILANGKAGLMDLDLDKQQLLQSSACYLEQFKDYGLLVFTGTPKPDQSLEQVRDLLFGEMEKIKRGDFDQSLIQAIADNSKLALLEGLKKNQGRVQALTDEFIRSAAARWDRDVSYLDDQAKVTKEEVKKVAGQYLNQNYVLLYKKKGEDKSIVKVEKPPISPVETNSAKQSAFVKRIEAMPVSVSAPQFLDFNHGFSRDSIKNTAFDYLQNRDNELFHLYFRFDMGSWNNRYLPLAAEYLEFLGTGGQSSADISKSFYNIACNYSVNVSAETTTISLSGLSKNMGTALSLLEKLLNNCQPDPEALASLRDRIQKSRANVRLNKDAILRGLISYARYGPENPFNYTLKNTELAGLSADTLVSLLHSLESFPHRIIYYGPLALDLAKQNIGSRHSEPTSFRDFPEKTKFNFTSPETPEVLFCPYDMVQAEIYWIRNGGIYDGRQEPLVDLFNNYFGGGMGSIVFQTIRESKALAYSTFAEYATPTKKENRFLTLAYVGCQADKIREAVSGMNELLTHLPLVDQNFALAKASIKKDIETARFPDEEIIFEWLAARDKGWDHDPRIDEYKSLNSISLADLQSFHEKTIAGKPYTYCIIGDEQKLSKPDLQAMGTLKTLSLEQIFGY